MKVCRTDLGLPGLPGFFVLPGPLRKVENVLHTYTVLDFIGESPYTRRVTDVAPCFEGDFWDSDGICGKVVYDQDCCQGESGDRHLAVFSPLTSSRRHPMIAAHATTEIFSTHPTAAPRATRAVRHRPARHLPLLQRPVVGAAAATHHRPHRDLTKTTSL